MTNYILKFSIVDYLPMYEELCFLFLKFLLLVFFYYILFVFKQVKVSKGSTINCLTSYYNPKGIKIDQSNILHLFATKGQGENINVYVDGKKNLKF